MLTQSEEELERPQWGVSLTSEAGRKSGAIDDATLKRVAVDTTVMEKGRCCTTLIVADSHCESMQLEVLHEQAIPRPLPHDELAPLHCGAPQAGVTAYPLPGNACLHA